MNECESRILKDFPGSIIFNNGIFHDNTRGKYKFSYPEGKNRRDTIDILSRGNIWANADI